MSLILTCGSVATDLSSPDCVRYEYAVYKDGSACPWLQGEVPAVGRTGTLELQTLTDGRYDARIRAVDAAGNKQLAPAVRSWRLQRVAGVPDVDILSGPPQR